MSANRRNMPRNHVLEMPIFVSIIRVFQFVLAIVLLGLSAYGVSQYAYDGFGLTLFTSLATMIITVYVLGAAEFYSLIYNYWVILCLDIFLVIFWLCSFAVTASNAHQFDYYTDGIYFYSGSGNAVSTYRHVLRVAAVFGAIEFMMFIITLAFTGLFLHRHTKNGGHCMPNPNNTAENVEMKRGPAQGTQHVLHTEPLEPRPAPVPPV